MDTPTEIVDTLLLMLNEMAAMDTVGITCLFKPVYDVSSAMTTIPNAVVFARSEDTVDETYVNALSLMQSVLLIHGDTRILVPNYHAPTGLIESFRLLTNAEEHQLSLID
jgi:hypothetical protein